MINKPAPTADERPHTTSVSLSLSTDVTESDTVVTVAGEVDATVSGLLRERLMNALAAHPAVLIADMSGVSFCDSSGLATLLETHNHAHDARSLFIVVAEQRGLLRPITLLGLDTVLALQPSLDAARAALSDTDHS